MPGVIRIDLSNFQQRMYDHAKSLFTAFGLYVFDNGLGILGLAPDIAERRSQLAERKHIVPAWLAFHVAVECLLKAVLLKHEVPIVKKRNIATKHVSLDKTASNYSKVLEVYALPENFFVDVKGWPWLDRQLKERQICYTFDIDVGTIGSGKNNLLKLKKQGKISDDEHRCLFNALTVFCDVRRNTDMHIYYGLTVGGSINQDLDAVYLPMVNLLFDIYHRD